MSLTKSEKSKSEKNLYTLEFSVDGETFAKAVSDAFHKKAKNLTVPGFRRGKAPRTVIEKMYGKGFFYEDAFNAVLPAAWEEARGASKLAIVGSPEFDVVSVDEKDGVVFSAKVWVKPEVNVHDYIGIQADKTVAPVTDEEIDAEINTVRERNSRETEVTDGVSVMGDICNIDYDGSVDGVPFDGGKGSDYPLKLGSGNFIPGFEEQVAGHKPEEEFDVNVTFPEDYHAKELAGKAAVFKTVIHKIRHIELPEADDDFAKDVSEFDTFAEYRNDVKAKIEERHQKEADAAFEEAIIDKLLENMEADIPEVMFEAEIDNDYRSFENRMMQQGLNMETYFKYTGLTAEKVREQMRPQAEKQVKLRLTLEKIAKLEKLKATKKDIDGEIKRIAEAYKLDPDQVRKMIPEESVAEDMKVKKAMDLVKEKAVVNA